MLIVDAYFDFSQFFFLHIILCITNFCRPALPLTTTPTTSKICKKKSKMKSSEMRANLADSNAIFIFQQKYTGRSKLSLMKNYSIDRMWMRKTKKNGEKKERCECQWEGKYTWTVWKFSGNTFCCALKKLEIPWSQWANSHVWQKRHSMENNNKSNERTKKNTRFVDNAKCNNFGDEQNDFLCVLLSIVGGFVDDETLSREKNHLLSVVKLPL